MSTTVSFGTSVIEPTPNVVRRAVNATLVGANTVKPSGVLDDSTSPRSA